MSTRSWQIGVIAPRKLYVPTFSVYPDDYEQDEWT